MASFPLGEEGTVQEYLGGIRVYRSTHLDRMHPCVLREPTEVIAEPLSIIFEKSWRTGEVPEGWRTVSVTEIFKMGKKEDVGNYRTVSITSVPVKVMEQLLTGAISMQWDKKVLIRCSQYEFTKGK